MGHTNINTDKNPTFGSWFLEKFGTVFLKWSVWAIATWWILWWLSCDETCIKKTRTGSDHHVLISCSVLPLNWEVIWPGLSTSSSLLKTCAELIGRLCNAFLLSLIVITNQQRSDYKSLQLQATDYYRLVNCFTRRAESCFPGKTDCKQEVLL